MSQTYLSKGLYKVISQSDERVEIELTDASHPIFKAHFEEMPLLPGFLQIDIVAEILGKEIDAITSAKFVQKILPDERLTYTIAPTKSGIRVKLTNSSNELCGDFKLKWN
ncbi:MAG: 3-hydroxyacyl-ACP dehydratase [Sulfurimonadaceae bacterium]